MIKNDHEFLDVAMKAYDNPSCITIDEFNRDLNSYIFIKKTARKYIQDPDKLRQLVNQMVIFYNCFGNPGTDLLLYKIDEDDVLGVLVPIILYLGWSTTTLESIQVTLNTNVLEQLNTL